MNVNIIEIHLVVSTRRHYFHMFKLPIAGQIPGMNYDIYQHFFSVHQDGLEPKYQFLRAGLKDLHFCWKKLHVSQVCWEKLTVFCLFAKPIQDPFLLENA